MATISDVANTRSAFPAALDTFPTYVNGTSQAQVISATIWNKIETALLRTQEHAQSLCLFAAGPTRQRVLLQSSVVIGAPTASQTAVLTPNAAQYALLGRLSDLDTLVWADVWTAAASAGPIATEISWTAPHSLNVRFHRMNHSLNLVAGTYFVRATLIG